MEAVPDVGGREQGDGMEKEEDEQHIKTFKDQDQPPLPPPTSNLPDTHQKQEKEEEAVPPICQMSEPLINNASSSPSMESAKIIRKSTGLLLPEAGGLVVSKLPPIHDNVDLRPTIPVCYQHQQPTSHCMSYDQKPGERLMSAEKAKVYPMGTLPPAVRKQREPKFVPYEPYKASPLLAGIGNTFFTHCHRELSPSWKAKAREKSQNWFKAELIDRVVDLQWKVLLP